MPCGGGIIIAGRYAEGGDPRLTEYPPSDPRTLPMPENIANTNQTPKAKFKPAPASFEAPKFEMPKFEIPKMEVPAAFREIAEKGIAQAKDNYEKMKTAAEEATDVLEDTYSAASKGLSGYGLKVIENARTNSNAAFDLFGTLMTSKSLSEVVETSTAFMREQFETATAQAKELTELATKVATESAEPMKEKIGTAMNKVAA
jgi:phasin